MNIKKLKQKGVPLGENDIKELFQDNETIFAYKYARLEKGSLGNTTKFIKHHENTWIHDRFFSRYGLFFFIDKKYLLPYMTYGDALIKIKITKSDLHKMKIKKHFATGIREYSCRTYYVDKILPLNEWDTLEFIANNADCTFPTNFVKQSISWLNRIGVDTILVNQFKNKLYIKVVK